MSSSMEPYLDIPERYEDVTAEWLTQALRTGGVLDDQAVTSFRVEPIGADQSRTISLARILVDDDATQFNIICRLSVYNNKPACEAEGRETKGHMFLLDLIELKS